MSLRGCFLVATFSVVLVAAVQSQAKPDEENNYQKYVVSQPMPEYPRDARAHRLEGAGIFRLSIDRESGAVTNVATVKSTGYGILDRAATSALRKWRFAPHVIDAVKVPVDFHLVGEQAEQLKPARRNAIVSPVPPYPLDAWFQGVKGTGTFQLIVNFETGEVQEVKLLQTTGDGRLDKSAIVTFRKWRFQPRTTHSFPLRYRFY